MNVNNKNGFTLIELIAVLVIMAIIALIATPLVMSIIRNARLSADKRSIDAYGRSIELALAAYLLDTGKFPTDISQLTIEYSGKEVLCSTTQLNRDSSVYLSGCTVDGRAVSEYTYGKYEVPTYTAYTVGNTVTYNNVNYYVIADSGTGEATVTLLKAEPLTVAEVNQYGTGHVNMYSNNSIYATDYQQAGNINNSGYGAMRYFTSETCGYVNNYYYRSGCINNYIDSEIKYVVDAWKNTQAPEAIEARLIQIAEFENLGYEWINIDTSGGENMRLRKTDDTPDWVGSNDYWYWTMSQHQDSTSAVWVVGYSGWLEFVTSDSSNIAVRPVIVLSKTVLSS